MPGPFSLLGKPAPANPAPALRYVCLDRRAAPGIEADLGNDPSAAEVSRVAASGIPLQRVVGCFLSNEYLDAFPVHQVAMTPDGLLETYVVLKDGQLVLGLGPPTTPALAARLQALDIELLEGQTAEICLRLDDWAAQLAVSLERGFVLTVDYGRPASELYSPELRPRGTLTTYYQHTQLDAPLRHVGRQDITAQVDFTSVIDAGLRNGLDLLGMDTQGRFLRRLGLTSMQAAPGSAGPAPVRRPSQPRRNAGPGPSGRPGRLQSPVPGQGDRRARPVGVQ